MRVFQSTYRDRATGQTRKTARWYVEFFDHHETRRRVPGLTDRRATEALGRNIEALVRYKGSMEPLPPALTKWLEGLPARIRNVLTGDGRRAGRARPTDRQEPMRVLDAGKVAALRPLADHLDGPADAPGWRQHLTAKGNTPGHVALSVARVKAIIDGCKFHFWSDVTASKVLAHLAGLQADRVKLDRNGKPELDAAGNPITRPGIGAQTFNFYLVAFKSFCKFMVRDGRASESPVAHLDGLNVRTDRRHDRRALTVDELRWLLDVTGKGPDRRGMNGEARSMLYRLAVESGLRANELRSLTRASFIDLDGDKPMVRVAAGYSKHRRADELPLRAETAGKLAVFLSAKLPDAPAFTMPPAGHVAKVLKLDLADARAAWIADGATAQEQADRDKTGFLEYADAAGRVADFHALRHTTGSFLAAAGVHPKVAQAIMRHSTIDLTMSRYTHVFAGQESDAVADLPDLSAPTRQAAKLTGTDGRVASAPESSAGPIPATPCPANGRGRLLSRPAADLGQNRPAASQQADGADATLPASGPADGDEICLAVCLAQIAPQGHDSLDFAGQERRAGQNAETPANRGDSAILRGKSGKAAVGFEPTNNGFANRRLGPLGYAAGNGEV